MCDSTTWAQFIVTCAYDQGWHDPNWGWLSLLTREVYHGVSYYWLIFVGILLLWGFQAGVYGLRYRMDNDSPLRIGGISGKDRDNPDARNLLMDYRFWAFLISTVLMVLWFLIFWSNSQPQNFFDGIGLAGSLARLSPSGMSLVKYYLGVWWSCGALWWVVSLLCLYIIWEDPFRYRRYRLVRLHQDPTAEVRQVQSGQDSIWEIGAASKLLYGPTYYAPTGHHWSDKWSDKWITVRRECDRTGECLLCALGEYRIDQTYGVWMPHFAEKGEGSVQIKDGCEFTVGERSIKYKSLRG